MDQINKEIHPVITELVKKNFFKFFRVCNSIISYRVLIRRWDPDNSTRTHKSQYPPIFEWDVKKFTSCVLFSACLLSCRCLLTSKVDETPDFICVHTDDNWRTCTCTCTCSNATNCSFIQIQKKIKCIYFFVKGESKQTMSILAG